MRMIIEIRGRGEIDVQVELMEGYFSRRPNKAYPAMRRKGPYSDAINGPGASRGRPCRK